MSLRSLWLSLITVATLASAAAAQDKSLKVTLRNEWDGARTSAPLSLRAFIKWQKPELLEGHLQVHSYVDQVPLTRWTSQETALSDSEQMIWFLTPRPVLIEQGERYVLETEFRSEKHMFESEQLDVEVPVRSKRVMVVAIVLDHGASTPTGLGAEGVPTAFEQPLLLQQLLSKEEAAHLRVHLSRVKPADLPADSLRLLGLDAVVLSHDLLKQLRPGQWEALRTWVLAGGSLTLIQTGPVRGEAGDFIQNLTRNEWTLAQRKKLMLPAGTTGFSPGMGQMIQVSQALEGDSKEWALVARLTLRLQPRKISSLALSSQLSLSEASPKVRFPGVARWDDYNPPQVPPLEPRPRFAMEDLTRTLMPESIQGMPFGLAASVLACCLFCIAPGDYLLLGFLKRRKWTWALFPLVALGFTGWMTHLAAEHNGRNDSRTWVSIVDVTPENEVVRTSRLELTYGASGRTVVHSVKDQWWTDLREEDFPETDSLTQYEYTQRWENPQSQPQNQELGERLGYHGSVPANYVVDEPVRQWAPRLQRITTLGADPELKEYPLPQIDWNSNSEQISAQLSATWPNALWAYRAPGLKGSWQLIRSEELTQNTRTQSILQIVDQLTGLDHQEVPRQVHGVFQLLTELSPTAAPDCEDLVITSRPTTLIMNEVAPGRYLVLRVVQYPEYLPAALRSN